MEEPLLRELAFLLLAALGGGLLAHFLRQPLIIGYILGGIFLSPFTPGPRISNPAAFEVFADIGVVLLMFSIGSEFSPEELRKVQKIALYGAPAGIAGIILMTVLVGWSLGWPLPQRLVIGAAMSVCSTMVLVKFLQDRGELNSPHGHIVTGIAIVGDLAVVAMTILLPTLNPAAKDPFALLPQALLKGALILGPFFLIARRLIPALLDRVARTRDSELLSLVTMVLAIGTAGLTAAAGLSLALGAFLAGLLVNESEFAHEILARILPMRDTFVAVFFASIGLLVQPLFLASQMFTILILVLLVTVGNFWIWLTVIRSAGFRRQTAAVAALSLTQIGEFSYVLAGLGLKEGLISAPVEQSILATSLITIIINALLFRRMPRWLQRLLAAGAEGAPLTSPRSRSGPPPPRPGQAS